jgi:type II secretion system protein G
MRAAAFVALLCLPTFAAARPSCDVVSDEVFDKLRGAALPVLVNYTSGRLGIELRQCLKDHQGCMGHDEVNGPQHAVATDNARAGGVDATAAYTNFMVQGFAEREGSTCILAYSTGGSHFQSYSWYGWQVNFPGNVTILDLSRVEVPVRSSSSYLAQQISNVHQHLGNTSAAPDTQRMIVRAEADIRNIETALDLYRLDNERYPTTAEGLRALVERPTDPALRHWRQGGYAQGVLKDPWSNDYQYVYPSTHRKLYDLYSLGPSGDGNAVIGNWALTP